MSKIFLDQIAYASKEISRMTQDLNIADTLSISKNITEKERGASIKSSIYVWLAAMLEKVVRDSIREALEKLSSLSIASCDIKPSLYAILCEPDLKSLADRWPKRNLEYRIGMFLKILSNDPVKFSEDMTPLDGKTIRPEHFKIIWDVFGLPGDSMPGIQHILALKDVAEGRNQVAHGNTDVVYFGKSKATADLRKIISKIDEIIMHFLTNLEMYFSGKKYLR